MQHRVSFGRLFGASAARLLRAKIMELVREECLGVCVGILKIHICWLRCLLLELIELLRLLLRNDYFIQNHPWLLITQQNTSFFCFHATYWS